MSDVNPSGQTWHPHVVVAAVVERDGKFLFVEEHTAEGLRLNQPAGHWERGEALTDAVRRETLEESAHHVEPTACSAATPRTTHDATSPICASPTPAR